MPPPFLETSIIVPTYRRPDRLVECLDAISRQTVMPMETIVVRRADDLAARSALQQAATQCQEVVVDEPGVLAAMTAGASVARGELIGFLDDDAAPEPDWLSRLIGVFDDSGVGVACGRDRVFLLDNFPVSKQVGHIARYGRITGNHHLGGGDPRPVEILKGANLLARRQALALPVALRGAGAQLHYEMALCLFASANGWTLVYEPSARVDHLPGRRFDADRRSGPEPAAVFDAAHNLASVMLTLDPRRGLVRTVYGVLVGDRGNPGMLRAVYAVARGDKQTASKVLPSLKGHVSALVAWAGGRRVRLVVFPRSLP